MTFYINIPKGEISLDKLLNFVIKRLIFLRDVSIANHSRIDKFSDVIESFESLEISDCLIDGTLKDKISHFILRIVCAEKKEMREFFIQSETLLFNMRLQFHGMEGIRKILHKAAKECAMVLSSGAFLCDSFKQSLCTLVSVKEQIEAIANSCCVLPEIRVPFLHALSHVKERLSPVQHGFVILAVGQISSFLTTLFELILTEGLQQLQSSGYKNEIAEDSRVEYLKKRTQMLFKRITPTSGRQISLPKIANLSNLDEASENFPLCMQHLYSILGKRHRLKHKARIQYILFLKEIGVPCEVVVEYFQREYSKPPVLSGCIGSCSHSWQKDKSRYVYSIHHLYGKRGACTNYSAHKCGALQQCNEVASEEGGCPFSCFDHIYLQNTLKACGTQIGDIEDIMQLASERRYSSACTSYMKSILQRRGADYSNNPDPANIKKLELLCSSETLSNCESIDLKNMNGLNEAAKYVKLCSQIPSSDFLKDENEDKYQSTNSNVCNDAGTSSSLQYLISCPSDFYEILSNDLCVQEN